MAGKVSGPYKMHKETELIYMRRTITALLMMLLVAQPAAAIEGLEFNKAFNSDGEPKRLHYVVSYNLKGSMHEAEIWREGNQRLKRRTDDAIETFVFSKGKDPEWRMVVLDLKRKIRTDIDRTNLYRVGHFTDWFGMSHGLAHPIGQYQLHSSSAPEVLLRAVATCHWYTLKLEGRESGICWSQAYRLPLMIVRDRAIEWKVTQVDTKPLPAAVFKIHDQGFVRNDANEDISGD
ncbi:MAG TPA: hypothetical protein VF296_02195 [Gallionella sp.]